MSSERAEDRVVRVVLKNATKQPSRLYLQPLRETCELGPGVSCELRARGPATGTLAIEQDDNGALVVLGWPGCILSVHTLTVKRQRGGHTEELAPAAAPTVALERRHQLQRVRANYDDFDFDDDETLG